MEILKKKKIFNLDTFSDFLISFSFILFLEYIFHYIGSLFSMYSTYNMHLVRIRYLHIHFEPYVSVLRLR